MGIGHRGLSGLHCGLRVEPFGNVQIMFWRRGENGSTIVESAFEPLTLHSVHVEEGVSYADIKPSLEMSVDYVIALRDALNEQFPPSGTVEELQGRLAEVRAQLAIESARTDRVVSRALS